MTFVFACGSGMKTVDEGMSKPTEDEVISLRRSAMDYLARREHSRYELLSKLRQKYPDSPEAVLFGVLDRLESDKLLSDARFTEAYIRYRKSKGYGPLYIRQHLQACRVDPALISEQLRMDDPDWPEILQRVLQRKFPGQGTGAGDSLKAQQKLQRFVLSRGFTFEQLGNLRTAGH